MLSDKKLIYFCAGLGCDSSVLHALLVSSIRLVEDINIELCYTAGKGHKKLCQLLIDKGADDFNQALVNAALYGHKELCEFFIDEKGATNLCFALDVAAFHGHKDVCQLLIDKNKASRIDYDFNRALKIAASHGDTELAEFFSKQN